MPDSTSPLSAAILGRVSRDRSREQRSVVQQQDDNRKACAAQGWIIPPGGEYQDIGSASRFAAKTREDWPRLLAALDAGKHDVVVMWEPSRGSRQLHEWALFLDTCRDRHVLIHVTDHGKTYDLDNPRDWRSLADDGVDSAYESEKTRQRILRDIKASAKAGRPHGKVQYGYERIYDEKTRKLAMQRPASPAAEVVAEIITRIANREPLSAIRDDLNARAFPSPSGGQWTTASMRRITRCPVYIGMRPSGGVRHKNGRYTGADLIPAIWPAIVAEDIWREAQQVLDDPQRRTTRPGRYRWLLSYIARCAECGSPMHVHFARRRTTPPVPLYECLGRSGHCRIAVQAAPADEWVGEHVIAYLSRPDVYEGINRGDSAEAAAARTEAARLQAELDDWAETTVSARAYRIHEAKLLPRIEDALHRARMLAVPLPLRGLAGAEGDMRERWERMPVAVRREVIQALRLRVDVVKAAGDDGARRTPQERIRVSVDR